MTEEALFDKIEAYLQQTMSQEERSVFESDMAADPALAERVKKHRQAMALLERLKERRLEDKLVQWRAELDAEEQVGKKNTSSRRFLLIAALLLAVSVVFYIQPWTSEQNVPSVPPPPPLQDTLKEQPRVQPPAPNQPEPDQVKRSIMACADKRIAFKPSPLIRGGTTEENLITQTDSLLSKSSAKNRFSVAESWLLKINSPHPLYGVAQKRLAYVYYRQGKARAALKAYQNYAATDPSNEEEHDWNQALYQLANYPEGETAFRTQLAAILKSPGHVHYRDAKTLQQELQKLGWAW